MGSLSSNFGSAWNSLATYNGKLYGVWFKGANKNTIWYNPAEFTAAGITSPPTTWEQLITDAQQLKAAGIAPFSLCTDVGWPVADFWQNVYLKTAGADDYNKLASHTLKWTDPTVTAAFTTFGQLVGDPSLPAGWALEVARERLPELRRQGLPQGGLGAPGRDGVRGRLRGQRDHGELQQLHARDHRSRRRGVQHRREQDTLLRLLPVPGAVGRQRQPVGHPGCRRRGDDAQQHTPGKGADPSTSPDRNRASIWANLGGFASPNKQVTASAYPDPVSKADAQALVNASSFVFSLDDLQGSWEQSMWADLINFLKNPSSVSTIESTMDTQAAAALGH